MELLHRATADLETLGKRPVQTLSTAVFVRALTAVVLLKVLLSWKSQVMIMGIHEAQIPNGRISGPLLWPARFAAHQPNTFFLVVVGFLLIHLFVRRNYWTAVLFSILNFNLLIMTISHGDGGDVLAFMLSVWAIFFVPLHPASSLRTTAQVMLYNCARIGCMLQFVFMYAASGIDKLKSNVWITGQAFEHMRRAGGIVNPDFPSWLSTPFWDFAFTWSTILFEIMFAVLVWFRSCQPAMVITAVIFHLGIWWMLDLPDFSMIMVVAVLIFVRDDQYLQAFKPQLLSA